jgi:acylphosphatase
MIKHLFIKIEGDLEKTDFNYYCQTGAHRFDINAVYVNGNTKDVEIDAEGEPENLRNYVEYLQTGPLKKFIYTFNTSEKEVVNLKGFKSLRQHKEEKKPLIKKFLGLKKMNNKKK